MEDREAISLNDANVLKEHLEIYGLLKSVSLLSAHPSAYGRLCKQARRISKIFLWLIEQDDLYQPWL